MPKVTDAHRESRRDQILDAALARFAERGFQATSMAEIIGASGLSAGAIYSYFPGKREIAIAAAQRTLRDRAGEIAGSAASGVVPSPADIIRAIGEGFDRDGIPTGLIVQLWGEAATDPGFFDLASGAFATLSAHFVSYLSRWAAQERGYDAEEAQLWAQEVLPAMLALGQGYFVQRTLLPGFDTDRYLAAVTLVLGP